MAFLRFALGVLIALGVVVVLVPAVVLIDLVAGGTGLGLCPNGLGTCDTSVFTISELAMILGVATGVVGAGIAVCVRSLRALERRTPAGS